MEYIHAARATWRAEAVRQRASGSRPDLGPSTRVGEGLEGIKSLACRDFVTESESELEVLHLLVLKA